MRLGLAQISAEKCRGGEHDCGPVLLDRGRDLCRVERIWIGENADRFDERIPKGHRNTKAVKEWERGKEQVLSLQVEEGRALCAVADDVAVGKDYPFRFTGTSACE